MIKDTLATLVHLFTEHARIALGPLYVRLHT